MGWLSFGKVDEETVQYDEKDPEAPMKHVRPRGSNRHPGADATVPHPTDKRLVVDLIFRKRK